MTRDASLEDFLDGSGESTDDDSADAQSEHGQAPGDGEIPVTTGSWHPDSRACDACGASVRRRWRDDAGLVCGDCKVW